jgi:hypothetical protein
MLTLLLMTRDRYKTVTGKESFVLLIAASPEDAAGEATFQMELGASQPVRLFTLADMKRAAKTLKGATGDRFFALLELRDALESRDTLALDKSKKRLEKLDQTREVQRKFQPSDDDPQMRQFAEAIARLVGLSPNESLKHLEGLRPGPKAKEDARRLLSYEVSRSVGLFNAQVVLWWAGGEFRPAIYCTDIKTAFYIHQFFIAPTGGIGYRICPHCGEQFLQDRANQDYCCPAHREAHRVARWRVQQKAIAATPTETRSKNGTQKTR